MRTCECRELTDPAAKCRLSSTRRGRWDAIPRHAQFLSIMILAVLSPRVRLVSGHSGAPQPAFRICKPVVGGIPMHHFVAVAASLVTPTITGKEAAQLILRWFHIIAGIAWVGLLYFFNLINVPFMKQVDAAAKPKIFQYLTLPALNWFRWSALATVFIGLWYWGQFLVAPDAQRQGVGQGSTFGLFLPLDRSLGHSVLPDQEGHAQRICSRRNHRRSGIRCGMALRELHTGRRRRQPRARHRRAAAAWAS